MNHSQNAGRAYAMVSRLGDWPNSWLLLRCGRCRSLKRIPVILLRRHYGDDHRLGAIVGRLRCQVTACRAAPDYVRVEGRPSEQTEGRLHSVLLVGPGAYG